MTDQETFDTIVKRMRAQGRPSVGPAGGCLYRGPNGDVCAGGAVISDDEYRPDLEGSSIGTLCAQGLITLANQRLVSELQMAHDEAWSESESELQMAHDEAWSESESKSRVCEVVSAGVTYRVTYRQIAAAVDAARSAWLLAFLKRAIEIAAKFNLDPKEAQC